MLLVKGTDYLQIIYAFTEPAEPTSSAQATRGRKRPLGGDAQQQQDMSTIEDDLLASTDDEEMAATEFDRYLSHFLSS